jgi:hypothetical protein
MEFYLFLSDKPKRHAAQAPALRERFHPSTFDIQYFAVLRFAFSMP